MWQWQGWIPRSVREYKSSIGMYWFLYEAVFNHDGDTSLYITYPRRPNTLESQMHFHTRFHQVTTICSVRQDLFFIFLFFMSMPHRRQVWACNEPIYLSCHRNFILWPKIQAPQLSSLSNHKIYWHHCQCILWIYIHLGALEIIKMHYIWAKPQPTAHSPWICLGEALHVLHMSLWVSCGFSGFLHTCKSMLLDGSATIVPRWEWVWVCVWRPLMDWRSIQGVFPLPGVNSGCTMIPITQFLKISEWMNE